VRSWRWEVGILDEVYEARPKITPHTSHISLSNIY